MNGMMPIIQLMPLPPPLAAVSEWATEIGNTRLCDS